ncbi:IucA/IucC family protein [Archangium lipolyticum]|uniref:IucA/IucC family protein n=1 Tax=Archangium lipolyticum TaxID=2970465 RepID=UPI002149AF75|nr:IucA/IucC family protein [Archangium lipolyticum]
MELTARSPSDGAGVSRFQDLLDLEAALRSEQFIEVRRRIFRQLVEALLYEGALQPESEPDGEQLRFRFHGEDDAGSPVRYECQGRRRWSFERIRLGPGPILRVRGDEVGEAESFARFLSELRASLGADPERLAHFVHELEQTHLKDTLAQYRRSRSGRTLRSLPYDALEGELMDGHPYHPSYKSRIGFDAVDHLAFGPEFTPELRPLWLAAHREWTHSTASAGMEPRELLARELTEATRTRFRRMLLERGLAPDDYVLLPVHPWQWREHVLATLFPELRDARLVMLGEADDFYTPQQSIRTLANRSHPENASLKLSLSILNTSTARTLAPHTVENAAPISDWLSGIAREDTYLRDELRTVFLREVLGISFEAQRPEPLRARTSGILACIWRESLHPFLDAGEEALPFTGLCHLDADGRPLIEPWVRRFGPEPWVRQLLEVSVLPLIHLLYAHGIALESHAQNMVLLHAGGLPRRVALKDFHDGIRFSPAHLAHPERRPVLRATPPSHARVNRNSYIQTEDPAEVRDFVHDAFFFINLGELALFLADHLGFEERHFWGLAREVILTYQRRFPEHRERFALFDLFAPTTQVEQLAMRRLYPDTEVRMHSVRNALAPQEGMEAVHR